MSAYRKRPVVIEAVLWTGDNWPEMLEFVVAQGGMAHTMTTGSTVVLLVDTLEGQMQGQPGDWIIRGIEGEFYPCKPDIFEATYEAVEVAP